MRKKETIEIGGKTVEITQWGARNGSRMLIVATRLLAGPLSEGLKLAGVLREKIELGDGKDKAELATALMAEIDPQTITRIVRELGSEDDLTLLCDELAKETRYQTGRDGKGRPVMVAMDQGWDDFFAGNMKGLATWLFAGIKLNFADFLVDAESSKNEPPGQQEKTSST